MDGVRVQPGFGKRQSGGSIAVLRRREISRDAANPVPGLALARR